MRALFLLALFSCVGVEAGPHRWSLDWVANRFDPLVVVVESTSVDLSAEFPSGHVDLRVYRASPEVIQAYSSEKEVKGGEIKDFKKAPDCTRAEIHALKLWGTNDIYQRVNAALRTMQEGKINGEPLSPLVDLEIRMIASGVNCAPQYRGPVARMENAPDWLLKQYQVPNYLGMRGFTSTTKGTVPAPYFSSTEQNYHHQMVIYEAEGADIHSLGIATYPGEKEVLIRPGTVFKVDSRKEYQGMRPSHLFQWTMQ